MSNLSFAIADLIETLLGTLEFVQNQLLRTVPTDRQISSIQFEVRKLNLNRIKRHKLRVFAKEPKSLKPQLLRQLRKGFLRSPVAVEEMVICELQKASVLLDSVLSFLSRTNRKTIPITDIQKTRLLTLMNFYNTV